MTLHVMIKLLLLWFGVLGLVFGSAYEPPDLLNNVSRLDGCTIRPENSEWKQYYPESNTLLNPQEYRIAPGKDRCEDVQFLYRTKNLQIYPQLFIDTFSRSVQVTFLNDSIKWEDCTADISEISCITKKKTTPLFFSDIEIQGCICIADDKVRVMFLYAGLSGKEKKNMTATFFISEDPNPEKYLNFSFDVNKERVKTETPPKIYLQGSPRFFNEKTLEEKSETNLEKMSTNLSVKISGRSLVNSDDYESHSLNASDPLFMNEETINFIKITGRSLLNTDENESLSLNTSETSLPLSGRSLDSENGTQEEPRKGLVTDFKNATEETLNTSNVTQNTDSASNSSQTSDSASNSSQTSDSASNSSQTSASASNSTQTEYSTISSSKADESAKGSTTVIGLISDPNEVTESVSISVVPDAFQSLVESNATSATINKEAEKFPWLQTRPPISEFWNRYGVPGYIQMPILDLQDEIDNDGQPRDYSDFAEPEVGKARKLPLPLANSFRNHERSLPDSAPKAPVKVSLKSRSFLAEKKNGSSLIIPENAISEMANVAPAGPHGALNGPPVKESETTAKSSTPELHHPHRFIICTLLMKLWPLLYRLL